MGCVNLPISRMMGHIARAGASASMISKSKQGPAHQHQTNKEDKFDEAI